MRVNQWRPVGRSETKVTALGFGGGPLGNPRRALAKDVADATLTAAWNAGIRYFDTAPYYGHGLSELRTGRFLAKQAREEYVISTKVGRLLKRNDPSEPPPPSVFVNIPPFHPVYDYSADGARRSLTESLKRLEIGRIDIALIHDADNYTHGPQQPDVFKAAMEGAYPALMRLREAGTVRAIGLGVNDWQTCEAALRVGNFDCFLLAGRYTLLEQEALDRLLPRCQQRGISIIVGGPFNSGILATGAVPDALYQYQPAPPEIMDKVRRIEAICAAHKVPLAAAALQFPLHHPSVCSVIPGMASPEEVARNVKLFSHPIPEALWAELKSAGLLRADAPTP